MQDVYDIANKGFLFGGPDPAEESKRTKRVQGWSRQIGFSTYFAIHLQIVFNIMFVIYVGVNFQTIKLTLHNVIQLSDPNNDNSIFSVQ